MEDFEGYLSWVYPTKIKKIEEVRQGYTYFAENDLLIAKIEPCFNNGKMSIAKNLVNGIGFGSTEFIVLRAKERELMIEWIYYCLRSSNFLEEGKNYMTGTARQRLSQEFVENYLIPLPSLEVQKKFVKDLKEEQEIIDYQKRSISLLEKKKERYLKSLW